MANKIDQPSGEDVIRIIRKRTDTVMLAMSCGKDAVAAWLAIKPHFRRVIPYYMYLVPDLEFVEASIRYYEQWFGQRIYRLPHPSLYRMLGNCVFQAPENRSIIEAAELSRFDFSDVQQCLRDDLKLGDEVFVADGVRAADSPIRRLSIAKHGPINEARRKFSPIWDWNKERLIGAIRESGVKLSADYKVFGRSFDGIDHRFLGPMKRVWPRDYARVLEFFPLAEVELMRRQYGAS